MRVVIYDDESLEPITVVNIPLTERDMLAGGRVWRIPVPVKFNITLRPDPEPSCKPMDVVEIKFEPFVRNSPRHGEQRSYMAFTRATELAILLDPAWLPGQVSAVRYLEEQNDALARLFTEALHGRR